MLRNLEAQLSCVTACTTLQMYGSSGTSLVSSSIRSKLPKKILLKAYKAVTHPNSPTDLWFWTGKPFLKLVATTSFIIPGLFIIKVE